MFRCREGDDCPHLTKIHHEKDSNCIHIFQSGQHTNHRQKSNSTYYTSQGQVQTIVAQSVHPLTGMDPTTPGQPNMFKPTIPVPLMPKSVLAKNSSSSHASTVSGTAATQPSSSPSQTNSSASAANQQGSAENDAQRLQSIKRGLPLRVKRFIDGAVTSGTFFFLFIN